MWRSLGATGSQDRWQLRILDKMDREKGWSQQVLQLSVVWSRAFIDYKHFSTIALCPLHKGQDSFQLSEEVTLTRLDRMLRSNQGHPSPCECP